MTYSVRMHKMTMDEAAGIYTTDLYEGTTEALPEVGEQFQMLDTAGIVTTGVITQHQIYAETIHVFVADGVEYKLQVLE